MQIVFRLLSFFARGVGHATSCYDNYIGSKQNKDYMNRPISWTTYRQCFIFHAYWIFDFTAISRVLLPTNITLYNTAIQPVSITGLLKRFSLFLGASCVNCERRNGAFTFNKNFTPCNAVSEKFPCKQTELNFLSFHNFAAVLTYLRRIPKYFSTQQKI